MKKNWLYLLPLFAMLSSGCGLTSAPNDLLRAPAQDISQESITQAVMQSLPTGAHLTVPLRPEAASAIQLQDLDADGRKEVVAFYKTDKTEYEIGVLILAETNGQWSKMASFTGVGSELDYVSFDDITGDRVTEMLLGFGAGEELNRELSVYTLKNRQPVELMKQPYSDLAVGDLNGDSIPEIALLYTDLSEANYERRTKAELYGFRNQRVEKLAGRDMEGVGYQMLIGKASPSKNALFVDVAIGAHSAYTALLVLENGQLINVLSKGQDEMALTYKAYPLNSEDIDQDGIIEIGILMQPPGTDELPMVAIPWINEYYRWDGKSGLTYVEEHYQSYQHGYDFLIPAKWKGRYTVERKIDEQASDVREVHFLYWNQSSKEKAALLSLHTIPKQEWNKMQASLKERQTAFEVVSETNGQITVAIQPTGTTELSGKALADYKQLLLTPEDIRQRFKRLQIRG